jgi:hypothetical protein
VSMGPMQSVVRIGFIEETSKLGRDQRPTSMEVVHRVITARLARKRRRVAFHKL